MMNSHAAKASPRCALVTPTSTIWSAGASGPTRWIDQRFDDVPARLRLVDDRRERLFRHPGIVLERQRGTVPPSLTSRTVPMNAATAPTFGSPPRSAASSRADVEIGGLDAHGHRP